MTDRSFFLSALLADLRPPRAELAALVRQEGDLFPAFPYSPRWRDLREHEAACFHLSVAAFSTEKSWTAEGVFDFRRVQERMTRALLFLADDVGHKAHNLPDIRPSARVRTRAESDAYPGGSYQDSYRIAGGCSIGEWRVLAGLWGAAGMTDPGGQNPIRIIRLPGSQPPGKERAELVALTGVGYPWETLIEAAGGDLKTARDESHMIDAGLIQGVGAGLGVDALAAGDRFFAWMLKHGMVLKPSGVGGWWKITCPWGHEHSDGDPDTGARYKPDFTGRPGGFVCDRGEGHKTAKDFDGWIVRKMLGERSPAKLAGQAPAG